MHVAQGIRTYRSTTQVTAAARQTPAKRLRLSWASINSVGVTWHMHGAPVVPAASSSLTTPVLAFRAEYLHKCRLHSAH